ncbi:hypothetical protein NQZ68_008108 [Dissostichus eleginoides]|nr:hypothetical protein NQZ68_008108 [Dissostichus eleginoides]
MGGLHHEPLALGLSTRGYEQTIGVNALLLRHIMHDVPNILTLRIPLEEDLGSSSLFTISECGLCNIKRLPWHLTQLAGLSVSWSPSYSTIPQPEQGASSMEDCLNLHRSNVGFQLGHWRVGLSHQSSGQINHSLSAWLQFGEGSEGKGVPKVVPPFLPPLHLRPAPSDSPADGI